MNNIERLASLNRIRKFTYLMDSAFKIPGTRFRFGWDPIIGLIPGAGDLVGTLFSAYIFYLATRFSLPPKIILKMLANVGLEATVGAIPLLGDIFDLFFKANMRNLALLEQHLQVEEPEIVEDFPMTA